MILLANFGTTFSNPFANFSTLEMILVWLFIILILLGIIYYFLNRPKKTVREEREDSVTTPVAVTPKKKSDSDIWGIIGIACIVAMFVIGVIALLIASGKKDEVTATPQVKEIQYKIITLPTISIPVKNGVMSASCNLTDPNIVDIFSDPQCEVIPYIDRQELPPDGPGRLSVKSSKPTLGVYTYKGKGQNGVVYITVQKKVAV